MEYSNQDRRMLLDSAVCYGFEEFGNEPYILSDDAEDYDQHDFPDVIQTKDQDEEKMDVDCKHEYILRRTKTKTNFYPSFQIRKVFNCKQHV